MLPFVTVYPHLVERKPLSRTITVPNRGFFCVGKLMMKDIAALAQATDTIRRMGCGCQ